jgi:hypothetical protein
MTDRSAETSPRLKARIAGVLYVMIIVLAVFAPFAVAPSGLMRGEWWRLPARSWAQSHCILSAVPLS